MASPRPGGSPGRDALENTASREELEQIDELMYTTQMRELRAIGSGSFGSAVLVEMVVSRERFVAKKIPLEHLTEEDKAKALSEAALLRSLRHDNITEYFGSFVSANTLHILMEYCSGGSLQQVMARRERNGETFDDEEVFDWFLQIAKALEHVHAQKILHRDIKTSNVFLTKRNLVKLGDFGIARQMDETSDFAQTCVGTPYYLSPEVIEGACRAQFGAQLFRASIRRAQFLRAILAQPARPPHLRRAAVQRALRRVGARRARVPDGRLPLPVRGADAPRARSADRVRGVHAAADGDERGRRRADRRAALQGRRRAADDGGGARVEAQSHCHRHTSTSPPHLHRLLHLSRC